MGFFIIKLSHPDGLKNRSGWKKQQWESWLWGF